MSDISTRMEKIKSVHRTSSHITAADVRSWEVAGSHKGVCAHCRRWARLGLDTCHIVDGKLKVCHA